MSTKAKTRDLIDFRVLEDGKRLAVLSGSVEKIVFKGGLEADLSKKFVYANEAEENLNFLLEKAFISTEEHQKRLGIIKEKGIKYVTKIAVKESV